jgi:hypothetical protein
LSRDRAALAEALRHGPAEGVADVTYVALKLNRSVRYIENLLAMPDLPANFENFACRNPSVYYSKRRKH